MQLDRSVVVAGVVYTTSTLYGAAASAASAPLVMSITVVEDTMRCYVQQHALPVELPGLPSVKYDSLTRLWFDDADALARFGDAEYMAKLMPDEEKFLDLHGCDFVVSAVTAVAG